MIPFRVTIYWRSYRWRLNGIAKSSADLLCGLLEHVPAGATVSVVRV